METLGQFLQGARQERRLTLGQLSLRAGVNKATLSRWEAGATFPRIPELRRVLDVMNTPNGLSEQALRLFHAPRAILATRSERGAALSLSLGDMLYGLRQRSGKAQVEVARAAGVSRSLLRHWESDSCAPSEAQLHTVCFALGASAGEMVALVSRPFAPAPMDDSRDAVLSAYQSMYNLGIERTEASENLQLLALLARASRLLRNGRASPGDVGLIVANFGDAAGMWRGDTETRTAHYRRALALADASREPIHFHMATAFRSLLDERANPRPRRQRIAQVTDALPRFRTAAGRAFMMMSIAKEVAKENPAEALRMADEYCALVADEPGEYWCRLQDRGRLLLLCGRAADGVTFVAATPSQDSYREGLKQLSLATGLLALGSHAEARACLDAGKKILLPMGHDYARTQIARLERAVAS